ncbi:MAG TPA: MmpS family transport accessory protein [Methylomirabilota bacterium]|jgi:hypothetical protein|nr:MmpS family transport accessory protein [Methylomirabilota bacterium]
MARRIASVLALAFLLMGPSALSAQAPQSVTRTFAASFDRTWGAVEAALKRFDWSIDQKDKNAGWILTDSRGVEFKDFGVYGEGSRHKLRLTLTSSGPSRTAVAIERELYREERILWMTNRKPLAATDQTVEIAVLDEVARSLGEPTAAPPPLAPPPAAAPPPAPAPPPPQVVRPGGRGEFTYKVTYKVTGNAGAAKLTYRNAEGGTVQTSVRIPWETSFDAKGGSFLYVSAQNQGTTGSVTCEILLEGETRTTSTSSGAYVIAECSNAAERN